MTFGLRSSLPDHSPMRRVDDSLPFGKHAANRSMGARLACVLQSSNRAGPSETPHPCVGGTHLDWCDLGVVAQIALLHGVEKLPSQRFGQEPEWRGGDRRIRLLGGPIE